MDSQHDSNDIKHWLKEIFFEEQLSDFAVTILGDSEKGDGYMGDIIFAHVSGKTTDNQPKSFDLVLKCSKKCQALRDNVPIKDIFENEIYTYTRVFPTFEQFQAEKGIQKPFDSVSPYFGKFVNDNMEILALQNLKVLGYRMCDRRKPLDSNHLKLLMREYGKLHAISGAMQQQRPEEFEQLVGGMKNMFKRFSEMMNVNKMFEVAVEEMYYLIKEHASVAQKLLEFKNSVVYVISQLVCDRTHFCAINHGDGWNNNFMFKYKDTNEEEPVKVAIVDWQLSTFASPIIDLSYLLYSCTSREELMNFEDLLKEYYTSFSYYVRKLGSDPEKVFPYSSLLEDWKMFAKYGLMMSMMSIKIALSEKDEVTNMTEPLESGGDLSTTFIYEIKNKDKLKERVLAVVEHAINSHVI